jgi:SAM-dependent methyltransferase
MTALYERIGGGYARARQPDPHIATAIHGAIGPARSVVNVGAGTGSYEPSDRAVVAVEPSRAMIAQRAAGSAQAIQGIAERLPFADGTFDVALATLTTHHWVDWRAGIAEMKRVARQRVVVLTFDPVVSHRYWLVRDYLPSIASLSTDTFLFRDVAAEIGGNVRVVMVPAGCRDGFLAAYWRRPQRYLDPQVRAGISAFHALPVEELRDGLASLEGDIQSGAWAKRNDELLHAAEFDGGYRLVVVDL